MCHCRAETRIEERRDTSCLAGTVKEKSRGVEGWEYIEGQCFVLGAVLWPII